MLGRFNEVIHKTQREDSKHNNYTYFNHIKMSLRMGSWKLKLGHFSERKANG